MRVQSINLNLIPTGVMPIIHLSQYDQESDGALLFMIYNGSLPYDLTGCTAVIEGTKSDSTFFSYPCTVYNNYITSAVYFQMTALAEDYTGELRITNGGDSIGTLNFTFSVERAGVSTVDVSETEIPGLLEDIQNSVDEAEYWAQQASQSAAGVRQWNGRSGSVLPMAGDYNASQITYDNTTSGLTATQAQAAIDELATLATAAEARDGDGYDEDETYGPVDNTDGYPSYCIENNVMYKNIVSCSGVAPSDDISGTYWKATDIASELSALNSDLSDLLYIGIQNVTLGDLSSGTSSWTSAAANTVSGYTPILAVAQVGATAAINGNLICNCLLINGTIYLNYRAFTTIASTYSNISVAVLYKKNI